MTSFQAVARVRRLFGVKKCGHAGTLDPMAEGVLPVCLGYATRFADLIAASGKQYMAGFRLGAAFDSFDTTGSITAQSNKIPTRQEIETVFKSLSGDVLLKVPAFSAKKIGGIRAYKLAREGKIQDAGYASMRIDKIDLVSYDYPGGLFVVDCGKGTYVRSIIHYMGEQTGACAAMSGLVRTKSGVFTIKEAYKLSDLEMLATQGNLKSAVRKVQDVMPLAKVTVYDAALKKLANGVSLLLKEYQKLPELAAGEECLLMNAKGELLALGVFQGGTVPIKLLKVFHAE